MKPQIQNTGQNHFGDLLKRYKTNVCDTHKTHLILDRCPKFLLNNKAVVKKKAISGERHLQRFVLRKYQTKAF